MTHRTTPNRPWVLKFVLVASVLAGWGLWHGYDAWIGYPRHNERLKISEQQDRLPESNRPYTRAEDSSGVTTGCVLRVSKDSVSSSKI